MPRQNNANNQFVKKAEAPKIGPQEDPQPWNRSQMEIEPMEPGIEPRKPVASEAVEPRGRYSDRIKISPMDDQGRAKPRALKGWAEGLKRT
jgi:hypothetical protein